MKVVRSLEHPVDADAPLHVAAGMFDGVHRGHQHVIQQTIDRAASSDGQAWVLTFDPHPLTVTAPECVPPSLTALPRKLELIEALGVDGVLVLPFTQALSQLAPADFIAALCDALPTLRELIIGPDWRFGRNAAGTAETAKDYGDSHGFDVTVVEKQLLDGEKISSTAIRTAILDGRFEDAQVLLGRPFTIYGDVVHGRKVGRRIGFPTANIVPHQDILPPHGVFAVEAEIDGAIIPGAAYYGHRSLDPDTEQQYFLETYLFDFDEDIYDHQIGVRLVAFIRPDQRFDDEDELKAQIQKDTEAIRKALERESSSEA